jgi:hypothetical protein
MCDDDEEVAMIYVQEAGKANLFPEYVGFCLLAFAPALLLGK